VVRRLVSAAVALAGLGLALVLFCPADASYFCTGGIGLGLMFGGLLLAFKAQKLSGEDPEDRAFARAVADGHVNPGAVAMHVKGRRLIKEGRKEGDPEKVKNGEWLVNRAHSFLKGGQKVEGISG
jgi:hypothetical protein